MRAPRRMSAVRSAWALFLIAPVLAAPSVQSEQPVRSSPRLQGPRQPGPREKSLRRFGGSAETERGVEAGLDWLARHQRTGGGWDADGFPEDCEAGSPPCDGPGKGQHGEAVPCPFDVPISALAALAFLGQGHSPAAENDPHAERVERALDWLKNQGGGRWSLPLSLQALSEAEALDQTGRYTEEILSRTEALFALRQEDGAFGYAAPFREGSDVPFTALCVQALVAARDAGAELPDDLATRIDAFLNSLESRKGKLAYLLRGRDYGYTPTATNAHLAAACRLLLQVGTRGARHRAHLALLKKSAPQWKISFRTIEVEGLGETKVQIGQLSMYQWWYGTIAAFQTGGATWNTWFASTRKALLDHQRKEDCARGSFDPEGMYERQTGGRVFATALGVLMLEQPYRHRRL